MTPAELLEAKERIERDVTVAREIGHTLFDRQRRLLTDKSKRKVARCGRRAGKSRGLGVYLYLAARKHPGLVCVYIALTKGHARRLLWPVLHELNLKYKLGMVFNETLLEARLPNGATIWLMGADKPAEIEKLRGGTYPLVCIDEAGSFGHRLAYLVDDVLDPALEDYAGTLVLAGTPPVACAGKYWDVCMGDDRNRWSQHHWTVTDNPLFPLWAGKDDWVHLASSWLANKRTEKQWADDNPIYRREWLGEYVRDDQSLVYAYDPGRNGYDELPALEWSYVLGVDLGFDDHTAFTVWAYCRESPEAYLVHDETEGGMTPTTIAARIKGLQGTYRISRIVADTGGLGKMVVTELNQRHSLSIEPAQKTNKREFIELMNDDLRTGKLRIKSSSRFAGEAAFLQWDEDKENEDPRFENHACDSALYSWREVKHYLHREAPKPKAVPELLKIQREKAVTQAISDKEVNWWE